MREDVLSLEAMAGDRVSQEYLKAELYHRAEALKDLPDTPLFFGRVDYAGISETGNPETRNPETRNPETRKSETRKSETGISDARISDARFSDDGVAGHSFHIGRRHVHAPDG